MYPKMLTGLPPTPIETARYVPMAKGVEVIEYAIPRVLQSLNGFSGNTSPVPRSLSLRGKGSSFISADFVVLVMVVLEVCSSVTFQARYYCDCDRCRCSTIFLPCLYITTGRSESKDKIYISRGSRLVALERVITRDKGRGIEESDSEYLHG